MIAQVKGEAEILVHEAQRETRHVLALEEIGSFDVEDAGAGHAGLHDLDKLFSGNAGARGKSQGFGESVDLQGENRVHGELDGLAGTVGAEMKKLFAHDVQDGLGFF